MLLLIGLALFLHPRCFCLALYLPFQLWHRLFLTRDISTAALVYTWQLVEHAKSLSVAFIPMLFNCINIKGLGTYVIVWLPLIGSAPP